MARKSGKSWIAIAPALLLAASTAALAQTGASELQIEPQHGQSSEQQWSDRYACYDWARNQSGFDPSRQGGGVPAGERDSRRAQYRRAMVACLEGRGYTVREASPAAPASSPMPRAAPHRVPHELQAYAEPVRQFKYHPLTVQLEGGYTVTAGSARSSLDNGWNAGLGLTWQPLEALPLAFRVDGSYSEFRESRESLSLASQQTGTSVDWGRQSLYGGDVDAQINLRMGPSVREYFLGGVGWYRQRTIFKQVTWEPGLRCLFFCVPGYIPISSTVERSTSGWLNSWNAGMGFEFALASPASFFIEARYVRLSPVSRGTAFVPIRFGLRF